MLVGCDPTAATVEFEPVVKVTSANDGEDAVPIDCGVVSVIAPVVAEPETPLTRTWLAVPVNESTPVFPTVIAPVAPLTAIPLPEAKDVTIPDS
jgi:hypothetical protein